MNDQVLEDFKRHYQALSKDLSLKNVWIIKPGENTNRGHGIEVSNKLNDILQMISSTSSEYSHSTYIIQKYIEKPLLIKKRKFDIRCYGLYTSINGW